ncbi:MAG TPA: hypothetical protein VFI54_01210 [Solirubrobacteraceae bacterium]|nr:hypothetical protein [Solirubrobacteraceae bacterium]
MATRDIRTTNSHTSCDVCGRTLLRGERAEVYLHGGMRREVCELCTSRALHEGWIREGTMPPGDGREGRPDRRRSFLSRLLAKREAPARREEPAAADPVEHEERAPEPAPPPAPAPRRERVRERLREPRHVRAIPTSAEHKIASAVELFNGSEHRRTIAGVARSLGAPTVSVRPAEEGLSLVNVVASWELCWYRYEVDLSEEVPTVRLTAQGYELDELPAEERSPNAVSDERGSLSLSA